MTEAASQLALSEVSGSGDTTEASLRSLKDFSRLLEEADRFARLVEKTQKYSDMVPPYILEQVQEDYRKQKREVDAKLEAQKDGFRQAYEEHLSEKEVLEDICKKLRDRIKELRFRRIVGEYEEDDVQDEVRDLKGQLSESMERIDQMEEILDQYVIIGFDDLMEEESAEEEELEQADEPEEEDTPLPMLEEEDPTDLASEEPEEEKEEEQSPVHASARDSAYAPSGYEAPRPESRSSAYPQGYLTILDGTRKGDRVPLIPAEIMLGSSPNTDVMLTDQGISESHARIFFKDRKYCLENLDVLGRSYVNGIQSKVAELNHNDVIRLGNLNLRVDFTPAG
jgi:ribosome-associated toxin RatA of RatAB toxin-antitoxin module